MTVASRPLPAWQPEAGRGHQEFSWRNYLAHALEGGLFVGGIAFLAMETVLPTMLKSLGAPEYLIGISPVLMLLGFNVPSLFTAHIAEGRSRMLPFLRITGVFQRLPFLFGALALWLFANDYPIGVAYFVGLLPLFSGLAGGVSGPAWMELTARILPPDKRASSLAIRFLIGALLGIVAGEVVERVLSTHPGADGYAMLHLCTFIALTGSYVVFCLQREDADDSRLRAGKRSLRGNLASIPGLLRDYPVLRWLILMSVSGLMIQITVPFMALHAQASLGVGEQYAGRLLQAQMVGAIVGNLLGARLGDRFGGLALVRSALLGLSVVMAGMCLASSDWAFRGLFCIFGAAFTAYQIGGFTVGMAVAPVRRRPTSLALVGAANATGMLLASNIGGSLQTWLPGDDPVIAPAALLSLAFLGVALFSTQRLARVVG
jgi:MFS family permease